MNIWDIARGHAPLAFALRVPMPYVTRRGTGRLGMRLSYPHGHDGREGPAEAAHCRPSPDHQEGVLPSKSLPSSRPRETLTGRHARIRDSLTDPHEGGLGAETAPPVIEAGGRLCFWRCARRMHMHAPTGLSYHAADRSRRTAGSMGRPNKCQHGLVLRHIDRNTCPKQNFAYAIVVDNLAKYL